MWKAQQRGDFGTATKRGDLRGWTRTSTSFMIWCVRHPSCMWTQAVCVSVLSYVCWLSGSACSFLLQQHCLLHKGRSLQSSLSGCWFSALRSHCLGKWARANKHRLIQGIHTVHYKALKWKLIKLPSLHEKTKNMKLISMQVWSRYSLCMHASSVFVVPCLYKALINVVCSKYVWEEQGNVSSCRVRTNVEKCK